eukprot:scpid4331/ scgid21578/ 
MSLVADSYSYTGGALAVWHQLFSAHLNHASGDIIESRSRRQRTECIAGSARSQRAVKNQREVDQHDSCSLFRSVSASIISSLFICIGPVVSAQARIEKCAKYNSSEAG